MLTDDDKQWLLTQIERNNEEVLATVFARLDRDKESMLARLERLETRLLTEFHKWASPLEMRKRSHAVVLRALDLEIEAASDRVMKLEGTA
jgi:hypothetical protein